jgi:hypothetical protein
VSTPAQRKPRPATFWILPIVLAFGTPPAHGYSQFTHEELIDLTWADTIRPLLLKRFPNATESDLRRAQSYAYGGCLIQDIGYYPFGKELFSDLTHYARSGDFVEALFRHVTTLDEFAFAIGALSHYIGDSIGHSRATNPATAITFPDLRARYGPIVTYEEAPKGHVRTEFGFDVAQAATHRYAARRYRKRIGFRVARLLLYRSFTETYGISTNGILGPARSAVATYRWSVASLLPAFLSAQVVLLSGQVPPDATRPALAEYLQDVAQSEYVALNMQIQKKPGIKAHLLAIVVRIIPKIGLLKVLSTKAPSTETEELFVGSIVQALRQFRERLDQIGSGASPAWQLPNLDLDTGAVPIPGNSGMVDEAHIKLALRVAEGKVPITRELREYLLSYFADLNKIESLRRDPKEELRVKNALDHLRAPYAR